MVGRRYFEKGSLHQFTAARDQRMRDELRDMDADRLLPIPVEDLVERLVTKYSLAPLTIDVEAKRFEAVGEHTFEHEDTFFQLMVRVAGIRAVLAVPFAGSRELLDYTPSTSVGMHRFETSIEDCDMCFGLEIRPVPDDPKDAKAALDRAVERTLEPWIRQAGYIAIDVNQYNAGLPDQVRPAIERRRAEALRFQGLLGALDIPLEPRDPPPTVAVALTQKRIDLPAVPQTAKFADEPRLDAKAYEEILDRLRLMGQVIERSPAAFEKIGEEHLRFHFLVILNSLFGLEGTASGETFSVAGKTDILIRWQGSVLFVAECKVWTGAKAVGPAIDQLLSYLTWRDSKTALMFFVRQADFSKVMADAIEASKAHPLFKRAERASANEARLVFSMAGDTTREVTVAVIGFWLKPR